MRQISEKLLDAWMAERTIPVQPGPYAIHQIRTIFTQYRAAAVMAGSRTQQAKGVDGMLRLARRMALQKSVAPATAEDAMGFFAEAFILAQDMKHQQEAAEGYKQSLDDVLIKDGRRDLFFEKVSPFYLKNLVARIGVTASQVAADRKKTGAVFYDCLADVLAEAYTAGPHDAEKRSLFVAQMTQLAVPDLTGLLVRKPDLLPRFIQAQKEESHACALTARYDMMSVAPPLFQGPLRTFETMIFLSQRPELANQQTLLLAGGVWGPYDMGQAVADQYASSIVPPAALCAMANLYETSATWALRASLADAPLFGLLCQKASVLATQMIKTTPPDTPRPRSRLTQKAYRMAAERGARFQEQVLVWQNERQAALG